MTKQGTDKRIVAGAGGCTWWESVYMASKRPDSGLPCCPHCGAVLIEFQTENSWWAAIEAFDMAHPGYREVVEFGRGKCFPSFDKLVLAKEQEQADG